MGRLPAGLLILSLGATAADLSLLDLAMPEARIVAGIDVVQARSSPFGRFLMEQFPAEGEDFQNFVRRTGFDPRHDVHHLLFASPGGRQDGRLVLARGAFNPERIIEVARTGGATVDIYRGIDVITQPGTGPGGLGLAVAFLDASTAAAGDVESVRGAIERREDGAAVSPRLREKAAELSGTQHAWFVSTVPVSELAGRVPGEDTDGPLENEAFRTIEEASGGVRFGEIVDVSAEIVARSAEDAQSVADVLRFLSGIARLGQRRTESPDLGSLLSSLTLRTEDNVVRLSLAVPEEDLEAFLRRPRPPRRAPAP